MRALKFAGIVVAVLAVAIALTLFAVWCNGPIERGEVLAVAMSFALFIGLTFGLAGATYAVSEGVI
jgi:hypothetical protein